MSNSNETTTWICDSCGGVIGSVEEGLVEWLTRREGDGNYTGRGLRLVHRHWFVPPASRCRYDEHAEFRQDSSTKRDLPLTKFLGADGLTLLLSFISTSELPAQDVLEMIKRLHIPGYEHARQHFAEAINAGVFDPNTAEGYYRQAEIRAVLDWLAERQT